MRELEIIIGYRFKDISKLKESLTHSSLQSEIDNERLEFLGDAVLNLIITDFLINNFRDKDEGELSKIRAAIVNMKSLAEIAKELGINGYIILGKGEELTNGRNKKSILARTYEAIIGAIFVDGGYEEAYKAVISHINNIDYEKDYDFKGELQERSYKMLKILPKYVLVKEEGPAHKKKFEVKGIINDEIYGIGTGHSKKEAEQMAAKEILKIIDDYNKG
jgi:ribonuclease-3